MSTMSTIWDIWPYLFVVMVVFTVQFNLILVEIEVFHHRCWEWWLCPIALLCLLRVNNAARLQSLSSVNCWGFTSNLDHRDVTDSLEAAVQQISTVPMGLCLRAPPHIPQDSPWDLRVTREIKSVQWNVMDFEGHHMKEFQFFPQESASYTNYTILEAN